ncbi:hypothetical protein ACOMHN_002975 [Nucella lapillus]
MVPRSVVCWRGLYRKWNHGRRDVTCPSSAPPGKQHEISNQIRLGVDIGACRAEGVGLVERGVPATDIPDGGGVGERQLAAWH